MENHLMKQAVNLVESWRYKYGTDKALCAFVEQWAFEFTGRYPASETFISDPEFTEPAHKLSELLGEMMLGGIEDPIAYLYCHSCPSFSKQYGFYPTPSGLVRLMNVLLVDGTHHQDVDVNVPPTLRLYEPTVGSAGMILQQLERICERHSGCANALQNVEIVVEDVNRYAIHAFLIQYCFKIAYLQRYFGKDTCPKCVTISQCNTLSRERGPVQYHMASPTTAKEAQQYEN